MKKYVNGEYIKMTTEEITEMAKQKAVVTEPTMLERIEAIEAAILEGVLSGD